VRGDRRGQAVELDHHGALLLPGLIGHRRNAAAQIAGAERGGRRPRELGIGGEFVGVADRGIDGDPITFSLDLLRELLSEKTARSVCILVAQVRLSQARRTFSRPQPVIVAFYADHCDFQRDHHPDVL
jgi:hypothetical protein